MKREYISAVDCFKKIAAKEGFPGFYRGFFITLLRLIPASNLQFGLYNYVGDFIFE